MIQIKKQDKRSFDIYLDNEGVQELINYIENLEIIKQVGLDEPSTGFNNKSLSSLVIKKAESELSLLNQENGFLIFLLEIDDINYLDFRLKQYLESGYFSPPELFNLEHKGVDITFYLKKEFL